MGVYARVEDPVLDTAIGLVRRVLGLSPVHLDLLSKALGVVLGALLRLLALESQVLLERGCVPAGVWGDDLVVPVGLDGRLKVLAVRRARMGNAVVAEPALKLRLMPLVVHCFPESVHCCLGFICQNRDKREGFCTIRTSASKPAVGRSRSSKRRHEGGCKGEPHDVQRPM